MDLVVAADAASVRSEDHGRVVVLPGLQVGRVFVADAADDQRRLHRPGQSGDRLLEAGIGLDKGRRRLRPDNEIRMGGIRRAHDFAGGRAGLGDSGDVGLALLAGQAGEVGEVAVPLARAGPAIFGGHIEIGLDQDGGGRGWRFGRLPHECGCTRRQQNDSGQARPEPFAIHALFSIFRPPAEHKRACEQRIDGDQQKGDAIDTGPGGELIDQGVVDLRVAELIPGNARESCPQKIKRNPQEWSRSQRQPYTAARPAHQHHAQAKQTEVEPQHQAECDQQQRRGQRRHVAIAGHGVADPVAVAHVPQESAQVRQKESPSKGARAAIALGREHSPQERNQPEPRDETAPGGKGTGERKRQLQQARGEASGSPVLPCVSRHTGASLKHSTLEPGSAPVRVDALLLHVEANQTERSSFVNKSG